MLRNVSTPPTAGSASVLGRKVIFAMAAATGIAVASLYYNQPMLALIGQQFSGDWGLSWIPSATQLGYALGLFLLVPLGDLLERRRLITMQFAGLALALVIATVSPNAATLVAASLLVGLGATVAQQVVPLAAHLATPERQGAVVGVVMSGLLCGVLLSRTLAGLVATHVGWRAMFALAVPMALVTGVVMRLILPRSKTSSTSEMHYFALLGSMSSLWRDLPALRQAALTQASLFAAFSTFWTVLAFHLATPRFGLGADAAGLFGIFGAAGILAAPIAGRLADRIGPQRIVRFAATVALLSWLVLASWHSLAGLAVGVILLDFGMQGALISNQALVYQLKPEARSRLNTLFMGTMFLGGAFGSAAALAAWHAGGWRLVSVLGMGFGVAAFGLQMRRRPVAIGRS